jgi:hypothetical protein
LSGADLYEDLPSAIRDVRTSRTHPYEFYVRVGFKILGVRPTRTALASRTFFLRNV